MLFVTNDTFLEARDVPPEEPALEPEPARGDAVTESFHRTPSPRIRTLGAHIGIRIMFCTETCFDK